MKFRPFLIGSLAALTVVACATVRPAPSFVQELNKQYTQLFTPDNKPMYTWSKHEYFAGKAAKVAAGRDVQPEDPNTWNVPREQRDELNNAYDMLQIALVPHQKKVMTPIPAARAQAYFDCWVEQSQRRWVPTSRQNDCRAAFYQAFCEMYPGKCRGAMNTDNIFRIYFDTNKFNLDTASRKVVANAVASYHKGNSEVIVAGHADRVGDAAANMELSKARAEAVRSMLIDKGIPATVITEKYFGENQPLVPTKDGVANRNNRRVLIVVR